MERKEFCPICHNHCTKDAPQCERGQAFFQTGNAPQPNPHHAHPYGHSHRPHHGDEVAPDSLAGLLMRSGHYLLHASQGRKAIIEDSFSILSKSEQAELERLLRKLFASWKK